MKVVDATNLHRKSGVRGPKTLFSNAFTLYAAMIGEEAIVSFAIVFGPRTLRRT